MGILKKAQVCKLNLLMFNSRTFLFVSFKDISKKHLFWERNIFTVGLGL